MTEFLYVMGGILPLALGAVLIRRFFLQHMAIGMRRNVLAVVCAWPIVTAIGSFVMGEGGIFQRLQNVPDEKVVIVYIISAVALIALAAIAAVFGGSRQEKPDA